AFLQYLDAQRAEQVASQGIRHPELIVVAAFRVETDHERRLTDPICERVDIGGQVRAAAFLATFDQDHAARVRNTLVGQRAQCDQRAEDGIAVVGAAATVEATVVQYRRPRR